MEYASTYEDAEDYTFGTLGGPPAPQSDSHLKWLHETAQQMAVDYEELFTRLSSTRDRVQETGHEVEATWQNFLSDWLPPEYEVQRRKYIVGEIDSGESPQETDIVVLRPNYPKSLRKKTQVLAGGVAAAFSVKSTLRKTSLYEAAESCARLERTLATGEGTPRKELTRPFPYGVLAHSHDWKADASSPYENVSKHLFEADQRHASNPRASLDLVCVPDLGTWNHITSVSLPTPLPHSLLIDIPEAERQEVIAMSSRMQIRSTFVLNPARRQGAILASFLMSLYARLALQNAGLKSLADSFSHMGAEAGGRDKCRMWDPEQALTPPVRELTFDKWDHFTFGSQHSTTYGWHVSW